VKEDWHSQHQQLLQDSKPTQSDSMLQFNDGHWSCGASYWLVAAPTHSVARARQQAMNGPFLVPTLPIGAVASSYA
jgi:hypothetical protein